MQLVRPTLCNQPWPLAHTLSHFAGTENDRLRHIRLHEQVNELPDANYAALKFFMSHLHK